MNGDGGWNGDDERFVNGDGGLNGDDECFVNGDECEFLAFSMCGGFWCGVV